MQKYTNIDEAMNTLHKQSNSKNNFSQSNSTQDENVNELQLKGDSAGSHITETNLLYSETFDIRNYLDKLEPSSKKGRYICPVCGGGNLTIKEDNGAYQCWNGCETADIRNAIAPLSERGGSFKPSARSKPKRKKASPAVIPTGAKLLLEDNLSPSPKPTKVTDKKPRNVPSSATQVIYSYSPNQWAIRYQWNDDSKPKGYDKSFIPVNSFDGKEEWKKGKEEWDSYRLNEVLENIENYADLFAVLWVEGEKCVEIARSAGIIASTFQGGAWTKKAITRTLDKIKNTGNCSIQVFLADSDGAGDKKAVLFQECCNELKLPCVVVSTSHFEIEGDIEQILDSMEIPDFIKKLEEEIHSKATSAKNTDGGDLGEPFGIGEVKELSPNQTLNQQAFEMFFGDKPWVCADGKLYQWDWDLNYYRYTQDDELIPGITSYCNQYVVYKEGSEGQPIPTYPYAKTASVKEVLSWSKMRLTISPERLNPPGINCLNGVVKVTWENNKPSYELTNHTPDNLFTYPGLVKYDPEADPTQCDRLLRCLHPAQQEVFLRNIAASIDLPNVRRIRGREIKALLLSGLGSNGKDALREVVSRVWGHEGMTSCSLADFANYDDGKKFAIAPLMYSRINWASENPQTARLDKIQALKLFVTGNKLHAERKGKDHIEFTPKSTGLFNVNDVPSLQGTMQAIVDRIGVLTFTKTFKKTPDPENPNELLADPRFAYDDEFICSEVAPAFLNKMLQALTDLVEDGIDYACTEEAFAAMQKRNNHLFQFCDDVGLIPSPGLELSAKEIWEVLEHWYIDQGTLAIADNGKREWVDQAKPSDKNVKGLNQVLTRFQTIFPQSKRGTKYCEVSRRSIPVLKGLGFSTSQPVEEVNEIPNTPQSVEEVNEIPNTPQSVEEILDSKAVDEISVDINRLFARLSESSWFWTRLSWEMLVNYFGENPIEVLKKHKKDKQQKEIFNKLCSETFAQLLFQHLEEKGSVDLSCVPSSIVEQYNTLLAEKENSPIKKNDYVMYDGRRFQVRLVDGDWLDIIDCETNKLEKVCTIVDEITPIQS